MQLAWVKLLVSWEIHCRRRPSEYRTLRKTIAFGYIGSCAIDRHIRLVE